MGVETRETLLQTIHHGGVYERPSSPIIALPVTACTQDAPAAPLAALPGQAAGKECGAGSDTKRGQPQPRPATQPCNQRSRKAARRRLPTTPWSRYQSALGPISAAAAAADPLAPQEPDAAGRFALVGRSQANPSYAQEPPRGANSPSLLALSTTPNASAARVPVANHTPRQPISRMPGLGLSWRHAKRSARALFLHMRQTGILVACPESPSPSRTG